MNNVFKFKDNKDKFKKISFIVAILVYMVLAFKTGAGLGYFIASVLTLLAIAVYNKNIVDANILFWIVSLISAIGIKSNTESVGVEINAELMIYNIGIIVYGLIVIKDYYKSKKVGEGKTLKDIIETPRKPIKLYMIFRIILWAIMVTTAMAVANASIVLGTGSMSLLLSLFVIIPTFAALTSALGLVDTYYVRIIGQLVLLYIGYMRARLGQSSTLSIIDNSIILLFIIIYYIEYRIKNKEKGIKK